MATQKVRESRAGTGQTTDATTHVALATFDVSTGGPGGVALNNCSIFITARCSGSTASGATAAGEFIGGCFKVNSGTLSQVGATDQAVPMIQDTGGTPVSDFSVSGNVITYYVTGVAATTINWFGAMDIVVYQPT
jgi:hypothetical protein